MHIPSLISLSCSTHPPSKDSSVTTEQEALKNAVENEMDKHWRVFSRGGNRGLKSSVTHPRKQNMWVSQVPSHCVPHCTMTAPLYVPPARALHRHAILPPTLSLEKVSLLWMTKFFREHFPSLKEFGRKLAVSWALKPVGTSWPFNYAWIHSSQSSQPFITGFGPKTEFSYPPGLTAPQVTSQYLFQTISLPKQQGLPHKDPHKVRRAQGQVQPWANPELRTLKHHIWDCSKQYSHSL